MRGKKIHRLLSILLVVVMLLSVLPMTALAVTSTKPADGTTTGNPFVQGTGGSNSFRIPAMVTLNDGTIVAAADARWNTTYDGGGLDTIVSYSTDNGANWNYTFANYLGDNGNEYNGSSSTAFIDPALATDGETVYMLCDLYPYGVALNGSDNEAPSTAVGFNSDGTLKLAANGSSSYDYYLKNGQIYDSSNNVVSGYTVDAYFNITGNGRDTNLFFSDSPYQVVRTGYLYLTSSSDGGASWSAPTLIPNVKTTSEQVCLVGPGRGLVTGGKIIFPVYSYLNGDQQMGFIYSSDGGVTWSRSDSFTGDSWSSESAVVELSDGTLRFFYRNGNSKLYYADYTWGTGWGSAVNTGIATNSNTQISAISYSKTVGSKQVILVSCPTGPNEAGSDSSSASNRLNGKIFVGLVSNDDNKSMAWQDSAKISVPSVNSSNQFMYSCLTELSNGRVAILYEDYQSDWGSGYYTMSFATYDLDLTSDSTGESGGSGSGEETQVTSTKYITLNVGDTQAETDDTGNYEESYTGAGLNESIAKVQVDGETITIPGGTTTSLVTDLVNGNYIIGNGNQWLTLTNGTLGTTDTAANATEWTITATASGSDYTIQSGNYYLGWTITSSASRGTTTYTYTLAAVTSAQTWSYNSTTGLYSNLIYQSRSWNGNTYSDYYLYYNNGWTMTRNSATIYGKVFTRTTEEGGTTEKTTITFTGVSAGTTEVIVGKTRYVITVNRKTQDVSLSVGGTATYTDASTSTPVVNDSSIATATLSNGQLTITGLKDGTTTVTTDTTVYNVTVSEGTPISIKENETTTISVTLGNNQTVEWSSADSSYVGVAGKYDTTAGAYTNEAILAGQNVTSSPVVVTATIKDADGNVVGTQKWLVTVTESDADTNTTTRYIYIAVDTIQNCTVYYSINGGELIPVNGTGLLMDGTTTGHWQITFFAAPDEGYALTYMASTNSQNQYYTLSDGNPDGTGSDAWPFNDPNASTIPSSSSDSAWKSGHGFRWALLEGNMTIDQMKVMFTNALALGCDGILVFTKNASGTTTDNSSNGNNLHTNLSFVAQKLPTVEKTITSIIHDGEETTYTDGMKVELGDTIKYSVVVTRYATNATYGTITYDNENLTDDLTKNNGISNPDMGTSTTSDKTYTYTTSLTLTMNNFADVVKDGKITNTVDFSYSYSSQYSAGSLTSEASAVADITVSIPDYVIDFGLPVEIDVSKELGDTIITGGTATYGMITANGTSFTYTPDKVLSGVDHVILTLENNQSYGVNICPASNVLYEAEFFASTDDELATDNVVWFCDKNVDGSGEPYLPSMTDYQTTVYGYTDTYSKSVGVGMNGSYYAYVGKDDKLTETLTFTFTGSGFDLIGTCGTNTGTLFVNVKDSAGTIKRIFIVNTAYFDSVYSDDDGYIYQVPLVHITGLDLDTYTVSVNGAYVDYSATSVTQAISAFSMDSAMSSASSASAIDQVYDVLDELGVSYKDYDKLEFLGFEDFGASVSTFSMDSVTGNTAVRFNYEAGDVPEDALLVDVDAFRVYDGRKYETIYYRSDEQNVDYYNVLEQMLDGDTFTAYVENSEGVYKQSEYEGAGGPQNEVYLKTYDGNSKYPNAIAFKVTDKTTVHISARAVGNNPVTLVVNGQEISISSNTEMYYDVTNYVQGGIITIRNTGNGLLALGNLKLAPRSSNEENSVDVSPALLSLTEDEMLYAVPMLLSLSADPAEPEEPEIKYFEPERLDVKVKSNNVLRNKLITVTITTSIDVAKLTINGKELKPTNSLLVKWGMSNTYTYVFTEVAKKTDTKSYEIIAYDKNGLASEPITVQG